MSSIDFSPNPVTAGIIVTIIGTVECLNAQADTLCVTDDEAINAGNIKIDVALDVGGNPTSCGTQNNDDWDKIDDGTPAGGDFSTTAFDTTGLGGQMIGFRSHYVGMGSPYGQSKSGCVNLEISFDLTDPFPDGTISHSQGHYGASPIGELVVPALIITETICEDILDALTGVAGGSGFDCTILGDRTDLAEFLTGELDKVNGHENPKGFLPHGFEPGQNLAAQTITLLLNLNLAAVLDTGEFQIHEDYALNIDPVTDVPSGITYDPVFINQNELADTCLDANADEICDSVVVLSDLGVLVALLDEATGGTLPEGTTVGEILDAALALLISIGVATPQVVNGEDLTAGDLTAIIGLINESYDAGVINGFVTAFDAPIPD